MKGDPGILLISRRRGMLTAVANGLDLRWQTVSKWKRVPLEHVFKVAIIADTEPEFLRPDFFAQDPLRRSMQPHIAKLARNEPPKGRIGPPRGERLNLQGIGPGAV